MENLKFDCDIFVKNILFFLKIRNLKIGELENAIDVSQGYFSRLKSDNNSIPSIDKIIKTANFLDISINNLLFVNYSEFSPTEAFVNDFVDDLIKKTENNNYSWNRENCENLDDVTWSFNNIYLPNHPLFDYHNHYKSSFNKLYCILDGDIFDLQINGKTIFLSKIICYPTSNDDPYSSYELYLYSKQNLKPIFCTNRYSKEELIMQLSNLYSIAEYSSEKISISQSLKDELNSFIKNN